VHCLALQGSLDIVKNLMVQYLVESNTRLLGNLKHKDTVHIGGTFVFEINFIIELLVDIFTRPLMIPAAACF